jgi:radical SAM-linked protein
MRTIQRIIRRCDLPVDYSKGFNPHMDISLAQPLPVGIYSEGEYLDMNLTEEIQATIIKDKLVENSPSGIKFIDVTQINEIPEKKILSSMAVIEAASYDIIIRYTNTKELEAEINVINALAEWNIIKKTKSGEKLTNIKPMMREMKYSIDNKTLFLDVLLSCGSRENLSAELFSSFIRISTNKTLEDSFTNIKRKDLYALKDDKLVNLTKYFTNC